jgi:hypothetical protein
MPVPRTGMGASRRPPGAAHGLSHGHRPPGCPGAAASRTGRYRSARIDIPVVLSLHLIRDANNVNLTRPYSGYERRKVRPTEHLGQSMTDVRLLRCRECRTTEQVAWCGESINCGHQACEAAFDRCIAAHCVPGSPGKLHGPVNLVNIEQRLWDELRQRMPAPAGHPARQG